MAQLRVKVVLTVDELNSIFSVYCAAAAIAGTSIEQHSILGDSTGSSLGDY